MKPLALCYAFIVMMVVFCLTGCRSDKAKLDAVCSNLKEVAKMTDNCHKMAASLQPAHEEFNAIVDRLRDAPEESERAQYVGTVSVCLKTIMEIQTGACGTDPEVRAILELPPDTTARQTAQAK